MTWALSAQPAGGIVAERVATEAGSTASPGRPVSTADSIRSGRGDACPWSAMLAQMTHNIRTPLNAVIGFADLMHSEAYGALGDDRYRQYVEHIRRSGERLLEVTEETLAMTALATRSMRAASEEVALRAALEAASVAPLARHAAQRFRIDNAVDPKVMVKADRAALRHALRTLISAAASIAAPGSVLRLQAVARTDDVQLEAVLIGSPDGGEVGIDQPAASGIAHDEDALALARTLFLLQGVHWVERIALPGVWSVAVHFEPVRQTEMF